MSALRRFLVDFDAAPGPGRPPAALALWQPMGRSVAPIEPGEAVEVVPPADLVARQVAEAVAAALAEADARHAADRAGLEDGFAATLAAERATWARQEGSRLADGFRAACATMEEALAIAAAAVLEPVLVEAAREAAVADLGREIASLITGGSAAAIAITGPEDLLAALRSSLEASGTDTDRMSFVPSGAVDVTVTADSSTIRTRLADWSRALRGRLGEPA